MLKEKTNLPTALMVKYKRTTLIAQIQAHVSCKAV